MNRAKIVTALAEASIYEIDGEEFINRIITAGVTSYLIDIYNFTVTFKGMDSNSATNPQTTTNPIILNLLNTNQQGEPLMVHLLKKAGVTHYEVFTEGLQMVYYEANGKEKAWI